MGGTMKIFGKRHLKCVLAVMLWIFLSLNFALAADTLPARIWSDQREGGYNRNDVGYSVAIDSQGNVIMSGYKAGLIDASGDHNYDAHAIKYSSSGDVLCTITYDSGPKGGTGGADGSDAFASVKVDGEDNIILAGTTSGDYYALGYWTAPYIRKYDKDCNPVWDSPVIINYDPWNSAWQNSQDIAFDKAGNIYVAGSVFGNWGPIQQQWAIWKFDKDGILSSGFPILYNYSSYYYLADYAYGIALDSAGNIIATGTRGVSGCEGCLTNDIDWHVRKYGPTGTFLWEHTYSGSAMRADYAYKVAVDSNDDIIVAGTTNKGTDNSTNINYDWVVIKYAKDGVGGVGQPLWTKTYESGSGRSEAALSIVVDNSDNVVVAGYGRDGSNNLVGRLALLSGVDGSQLDEIVFPETNLILYGVTRRGNLLAVTGYIGVSPNLDTFTALLAAAPPLTAPAAGAQWEPFSKQTILWDKTLISGKSKVDLLYSTDSGATWAAIKQNTGNSGKYVWSVPDIISPAESYDTCMISVSNVDERPQFLASPLFSIGFPKIDDFNNKKVFAGDTITVTGQFFGEKAGKVNFGKGKGKVVTWTPTSISVQVPTKGVVSGPFGIATAAKNTATSPANLVILPKITKVSPSSGSEGKKVTISGNGFGVTQNLVFFNGVPANVLTWSDTKISAEVPVGATTGPIQVTNAAGDSADGPTFTIID